MAFLDKILGRKADLPVETLPEGVSPHDARAVDRYERMLRTAPPSTIEAVHVEAFEKLTPAQLDLLFERFTAEMDHDADRPADARPQSLARSAARAEARKPGAISRILRSDPSATGAGANAWFGASMLDTVANIAIVSLIWDSWGGGYGYDGYGESAAADGSGGSDGSGGVDGSDGGGWDGFGDWF